MDMKELQKNCNCAKCVHCFDEFDHYRHLKFIPYDQPKRDSVRYYCNENHEYIMPNNIRPCFKSW